MLNQSNAANDPFNGLSCSRNTLPDRRRQRIRTAFYSIIKNRRSVPRRELDQSNGGYYVDVHERPLFYIAVGAILLCVADAYFTITLLNFFGSRELNPVMDYFIKQDLLLFFIVKFLITSLGVLFLVMHKNFKILNKISGLQILYACFFMYAALVCYELLMIMFVPIANFVFQVLG